jgi:hypothetical protein
VADRAVAAAHRRGEPGPGGQLAGRAETADVTVSASRTSAVNTPAPGSRVNSVTRGSAFARWRTSASSRSIGCCRASMSARPSSMTSRETAGSSGEASHWRPGPLFRRQRQRACHLDGELRPVSWLSAQIEACRGNNRQVPGKSDTRPGSPDDQQNGLAPGTRQVYRQGYLTCGPRVAPRARAGARSSTAPPLSAAAARGVPRPLEQLVPRPVAHQLPQRPPCLRWHAGRRVPAICRGCHVP